MDTTALVDERKAAGWSLIRRLVRKGFDVAAACWVKSGETGRWSLYIASDVVDRKGHAAAYRDIHGELATPRGGWLSTSDVRLVGLNDPIGRDLTQYQSDRQSLPFSLSQPSMFGSVEVEDLCLYDPSAGDRLSFDVNYWRKNGADRWLSWLERRDLLWNCKARGAVGYFTARWEDQARDDGDRATVSVFVEIEPNVDEAEILTSPPIRRMFRSRARAMADEMFKARHPDAVIEHVGDD